MQSPLFTIHWKDFFGAMISAIIASVFAYVATLTDLATISTHAIVMIALTTAAASLAKAFTTDQQGYLLGGSFKVK